MRAYARERLEASGEARTLAARHADYYLALEAGLPEALRRQVARGLGAVPSPRAGLAGELDNVRTALRWCLEHGAAERALAFAVGPLWGIWAWGGHYAEGRRWVTECLAAGGDLPPWLRAAGHLGAGVFAQWMGDYGASRVSLETSLALWRETGETPLAALSVLGIARWLDGDDAGAVAAIRASLAGAEAAGDDPALAHALRDLSHVARTQGDFSRARALLERSLAAGWAHFTQHPGEYLRGASYLGRVAYLEGEVDEAATQLRDALAGMARERTLSCIPDCLEWLAAVLGEGGHPHEAARLLGAAAAGRRVTHRLRFRRDDPAFEQDAAAIRARLTPEAFRAAWAEGEQMSLEQATAVALEASGGTDRGGATADGAAAGPPWGAVGRPETGS